MADIYEGTVCGNGFCERPEEFPALGRFGCASDCGLYTERTQIRIDALPAWSANLAGLSFPGFKMSAGEGDDVRYTYNVYSETLGAYLLATDSSLPSITLDVPDGDLRLELYQTLGGDMVGGRLAANSPVAPGTMPPNRRRSDWEYGDAAQAIAAAAAVNRQLQDFCDGAVEVTITANSPATAVPKCGDSFNPAAVGEELLGMYGLAGNITILGRAGRQTVASFPYCSLLSGAGQAFLDPALCGRRGSCYNGTTLARFFRCASSHSFSVWSFGPPRNVTVRPPEPPPDRTLTPFNSLIGGAIITQHIFASINCTHPNSPSVTILTGRFPCQAPSRATAPFGVDPAFQPASRSYNGKLVAADYYAPNEMRSGSGGPYAFFPHQWGHGSPKDPSLISPENSGTYKLYFDARLHPERARALARTIREGDFITALTESVDVEVITYNPDFNLFGVLTVQFGWSKGGGIRWDYQYNTALLSPYEGTSGLLSFLLDGTVCLLLSIDVVRELREMNHFRLRDDLVHGYLLNFWNCFEWAHFLLLSLSFIQWAAYNQYLGTIRLLSTYPVLANLEADARGFATDAAGELALIEFAGTMGVLSELQNTWTALSCSNVLFFVLRFLKVLDFQPRMSLITRTLHNSMLDLSHYLALIGIILTGYASVGTLLVGDRVKDFQTFWGASCALFTILMGWEPQDHYAAMLEATSQANLVATSAVYQFFFWSWVLIATFLMLNIVMAIIVAAFAQVKKSLRNAPTLVAELSSLSQYAVRVAANRLVGNEWLVSDREFETVLAGHARRIKAKQGQTVQIRPIGRSKAIRIPGGLRVTVQDMEDLLKIDSRWACRKSLALKTKAFRSSARQFLGLKVKSGRWRSATHEDGVLIAETGKYRSTFPIHDLMNRYGEHLCDGHDDDELLDLLKTERLRQEMGMCISQNQARERMEKVVSAIDPLVSALLPEDTARKVYLRRGKKRAERLRRTQARYLKSKADFTFQGRLKVTVVAAKHLPKLDIFSESDPYCVLLMEDRRTGCRVEHTVLANTDVRSNDANPIWNADYALSLRCTAAARLIIAVLDRDEGGNDDLLGTVRIAVAELPVSEEVDRWYRLRNDSDPTRTRNRKALLRLKVTLVPEAMQVVETVLLPQLDGEPSVENHGSSELVETGTSPMGPEPEPDRQGLHKPVQSVGLPPTSAKETMLAVTLISAFHLPKRGRLFSKLSLCDPYVVLNCPQHVTFESIVRKNTYNPIWKQSFAIRWEGEDDSDSDAVVAAADAAAVTMIRVTVMDWNRFSEHDMLGTFEISRLFLHSLLGSEMLGGEERLHTFAMFKDGAEVIGGDGFRSEVMLGFRLTQRRLGREASSRATAGPALDDDKITGKPAAILR